MINDFKNLFASLGTSLIRDGMAGFNNPYVRKLFALAFLDHHETVSNSFTENLIQGAGNGVGGFAGANHIKIVDVIEIENVVLHAKESIFIVKTHGFPGGLVWIYLSEGGVNDIRGQSSAFNTSMGKELFAVLDHDTGFTVCSFFRHRLLCRRAPLRSP